MSAAISWRDGSGAGRRERLIPVPGDTGRLVVLPFLEVRNGQVDVVAGVVDILVQVHHIGGLEVDLIERPRGLGQPAAPLRDVGGHLLARWFRCRATRKTYPGTR